MTFGAILLLAVGLAMDAVAVAAAKGLATPHLRGRDVVIIATLFGGFQALMPFLGWMIGARVGPFIEAWDHWIVFGVLGALGAKMLWDALRAPRPSANDPEPRSGDGAARPFALRGLLILAIATSIDALAVGVTLPMLGAPLALSVAIIGITTALLCALAVLVGRRLGAAAGRQLDALGGLILIGIGTKILLEHLAR